MKKIRTFVALKIPSKLEAAFEDLISELRQFESDVKWVKPASIHITLKFLGEITAEEVEAVCDGVASGVKGMSKFNLKTESKGAFPSINRPRVFWVGLHSENKEKLLQLQKSIEAELEERGFPKEKRAFKPHLTIGRVRSPRGIHSVSKVFSDYQSPEIEIPVETVLVMKSELTRQGAIYTVQKSFGL